MSISGPVSSAEGVLKIMVAGKKGSKRTWKRGRMPFFKRKAVTHCVMGTKTLITHLPIRCKDVFNLQTIECLLKHVIDA